MRPRPRTRIVLSLAIAVGCDRGGDETETKRDASGPPAKSEANSLPAPSGVAAEGKADDAKADDAEADDSAIGKAAPPTPIEPGWTRVQLETAKDLWAVAFGGGVFVASGDASTLATSRDGTHWTDVALELDADSQINEVLWGAGRFLAAGTGGWTLTSADGTKWAKGHDPDKTFIAVYTRDGAFWAIGRGDSYRSADGLRWTDDGDAYAGYGDLVAVSPHATVIAEGGATKTESWTGVQVLDRAGKRTAHILEGEEDPPVDLVWARERFWLLTNNHALWSSADGADWTSHPLQIDLLVSGLAVSNDHIVIVGNEGLLLASKDGAAFNNERPEATDNLAAVTFGAARFVAVGEAGKIVVGRPAGD